MLENRVQNSFSFFFQYKVKYLTTIRKKLLFTWQLGQYTPLPANPSTPLLQGTRRSRSSFAPSSSFLIILDHQIGVIDQRYKEPDIVGALSHLHNHLSSKFDQETGVIDQRYELMFVIYVLITVMTWMLLMRNEITEKAKMIKIYKNLMFLLPPEKACHGEPCKDYG